jgi:hypothetical protein
MTNGMVANSHGLNSCGDHGVATLPGCRPGTHTNIKTAFLALRKL